MQKKIYIVRHGETELNRNRIIQGSGIDASLNDTGHKQAKAFHKRYSDRSFDVVLTSALRRTHETMAPFIEHGLPWEQFPEINEMGWGIYEGKPSTPEMKAVYQTMLDAWNSGDYEARIPGGESARQLADRLFIFVEHLKQRPEENILICSHGRAMRCLMTLLQRQELSEMNQYHHSNTGLYLVDYRPDEFIFQLENDLAHLEGIFPQKA